MSVLQLWQQIIAAYPEIQPDSDFVDLGIILQNDGDGYGDYIAKWDYSKPIPDDLKLGK
jgi:hypothetical protein